MMWGYYDGVSWIWMAAMMVLFWGGIVALAVWGIRALAGPRGGGGRDDDALKILRRRFAAGEITQDEYERNRRLLQG